MKRKFSVRINDAEKVYWEVVCNFWIPSVVWAIFYGPRAREFARNHAKTLNSLPKGYLKS